MPKKGIPERWEDYSKMGKVIKGTTIMPIKVPLKENLTRSIPPEERFSPESLMSHFREGDLKLGGVVDLTFTTRYYDYTDFTNNGFGYKKVGVPGQVIPTDGIYQQFAAAVNELHKEGEVTCVHCTHGLNRSGYMICRYMIEVLKIEPKEAIDRFEEARGHKMERMNYKEDLMWRKPGVVSQNAEGAQGVAYGQQCWGGYSQHGGYSADQQRWNGYGHGHGAGQMNNGQGQSWAYNQSHNGYHQYPGSQGGYNQQNGQNHGTSHFSHSSYTNSRNFAGGSGNQTHWQSDSNGYYNYNAGESGGYSQSHASKMKWKRSDSDQGTSARQHTPYTSTYNQSDWGRQGAGYQAQGGWNGGASNLNGQWWGGSQASWSNSSNTSQRQHIVFKD